MYNSHPSPPSLLSPSLLSLILSMISFTLLINRLSTITRTTIRYLNYSHCYPETVAQILQHDCLSVLLLWFKDNQMKANPDKFQAISFGKKGNQQIYTDFTLGSTKIQCEDSVVLLGIEIDHLLTFNKHVHHRDVQEIGSATSGPQTSRPPPHHKGQTCNISLFYSIKFQLLSPDLALL